MLLFDKLLDDVSRLLTFFAVVSIPQIASFA
jgi:hypothetical protein